MPWWLSFALEWFPAVLVALLVAWVLDLPAGATMVVFLILVGVTMAVQRVVRAARGGGSAAGGGKPPGTGGAA